MQICSSKKKMNAKTVGSWLTLIEYGSFLSALGLGWHLLGQISSSCSNFRFLGIALILIAVAILILFYVGCATLDAAPEFSKTKSLCCSMPLIFAVAALGIFAWTVSRKGGGKSIDGRSYKEYHIESYSKWMQNKVNDDQNWVKYYQKAVVKGNVCEMFGEDYQLDTLDEFHTRNLSPFESGCCKPPEDCNFTYTNPTIWVKPENSNYTDVDCNRWDNNPNIRCFDCQSCKAAFLEDVTGHWYDTGVILMFLATSQVLVGLILIYTALSRDSSQGYDILA